MADDTLGFTLVVDYDKERVNNGFLTESKRIATLRVEGWNGISEIEMLDVIDDLVRDLPGFAAEMKRLREQAIRQMEEQADGENHQ